MKHKHFLDSGLRLNLGYELAAAAQKKADFEVADSMCSELIL